MVQCFICVNILKQMIMLVYCLPVIYMLIILFIYIPDQDLPIIIKFQVLILLVLKDALMSIMVEY